MSALTIPIPVFSSIFSLFPPSSCFYFPLALPPTERNNRFCFLPFDDKLVSFSSASSPSPSSSFSFFLSSFTSLLLLLLFDVAAAVRFHLLGHLFSLSLPPSFPYFSLSFSLSLYSSFFSPPPPCPFFFNSLLLNFLIIIFFSSRSSSSLSSSFASFFSSLSHFLKE